MLTENTSQLAILEDFQEGDLPKRAGIQKGRLKAEHGAWIGYWNERVWDPKLRKSKWHRRSIKVCPLTKINEKTGREVKVQKWEAQQVFDDTVLSRMNVRTTNPPALATVQELWERKIEPQIVVRARKTQEHWRNMMKNHILPSLGKRQLRDVRADDVQDLVAQELAKGSSPQTVWHVRTTISSLFKRAKGIGWFSGDLPTEGVQMPRMRHEERQALTRQQLTSLIENLKSPARELVAFLSMTGLRKSELQGLRWKRVNLTDKPIMCDGQPLAPYCIAIREQYLRVYGKHLKVDRGQWQELKTREQGVRDIPLSQAAIELLSKLYAGVGVDGDTRQRAYAGRTGTRPDGDEHRQVVWDGDLTKTISQTWVNSAAIAGRDGACLVSSRKLTSGASCSSAGSEPARQQPNPNSPVFVSRNGTPINSDNVLRRHVKPILIKLGLPPETDLHAMRHTQASLADQAGATPAERQKILGHVSRRMTERYTHAELERVRPAMETASEGIGEALRKPAAKVLEIRKGRKAG